jgi:hypothetical protein
METTNKPYTVHRCPKKKINFLKQLESFFNLHYKNNSLEKNSSSLRKKAYPSVIDQVIKDPSIILDPYIVSLSSNYYCPLFTTTLPHEMEELDNNPPQTQTASKSPSSSPSRKKIVTAEDSIETITELLAEMEEDELPVQTQPTMDTFQPSSQVQPSFFNHRFAIYRKGSTPYVANAPSQLNLFKSFCKSLKTIDPQVQILPMRSDRQIHPLSTSDQINNIDDFKLL